MPRDTDATVLIIEDDREQAGEYADWLEGYAVRIAGDGESALDALDEEVDVILLDGDLPDPPSEELLGRLRARQIDSQIGLLSGVRVGSDVFRLDIDEYVPRPLDRDELRETVARLVDHGAVERITDRYLSLVARRRQIEARRDDEDLTDDDRYRELTGEIAGRRQQLSSLLERIDDPAASGDESSASSIADARSGERPEPSGGDDRPLYRVRSAEFYGLWLVAALTYGLGDVLSTLYATIAVPGLIEGNPAVNALLENFGIPGFLLLKLLVFLVLISVSVQGARARERFSYYWPPVLATAIGVLLTGSNLRLIVGA
ncbi:response regulator [Halorubrum sp. GN11_10-6_MGM]|uniref:response regulator transcription factor n=1 Tax=Halorubrum sp. GN11_10-6_MGM TaxID=2518112 RepID=UPI0010F6F3AC|nr:response regulator [Halorubrum sp. GN11_10-6_MGM]TKX73137.1 response regulator [Halorubrum sp. GN11_10-6_MGM]